MKIFINYKKYIITDLKEIKTLVPPEEIIMFELSNCGLKNLPDNIFDTFTNLEELELVSNKLEYLPENIFKHNTKLTYIGLGYNMLIHLPKNIFKNNTNLLAINLSYNKLKHLPEEIFKFNTKLNKLSLSNNNLTNIPDDIYRHNINLEILYLSRNNLTELPENIFQYNTNLQTINLSFNILTTLPENIFSLNTNLLTIYLYNNKLTHLPISLLNCNRLRKFLYSNNELNYIPPNMQRFLNRLTNRSNYLQIYNDGQNVHNHMIQECIKNSINNILSIPKTIDREKIMQYIVESKLSHISKQLILEYCNDNTIHTILNVTFEETLLHMFQYIVDHFSDNIDNIMNILDSDMQDSECKCFTGRISRLINCLSGISKIVEVKIPENMERSNIVIMLMKKYSGHELVDNITKEFTERGYQSHIQEYIEAL